MRTLAVFLIAVALVGCTRLESKSKVSIQMPDRAALQRSIKKQVALPTDKKICFGINVTGSGIPTTPGISCGGTGLYAGFVGENETLVVGEVPRGEQKFELLVYLQNLSDPCPQFDLGTMSTDANKARLFSSGTSTATISGDTTVTINVDFPGANSPLTSSCWGLKAKLLASGDLLDANGTVLAGSSPVVEGAFKTPFDDVLAIGMFSSGGFVNIASDNIKVPESIHSLTRKPDTGVFYGLRQDGTIVKLNLSSGAFSEEEISPAACPFLVTNCQVPLWMQSISAGYSKDLFGLDHAGTIYSLKDTGPAELPINVGPFVTQVSYY